MFNYLARSIDREPPQDEIQALLEEHPMWAKQQMVVGMVVAAMLLAALGAFFFYLTARNQPPPTLYMVDKNDNVTRAVTQKVPNMSATALRQWSKEVVQKTYTFNFRNIDDQILTARPYFTNDGWAVFYSAWQKSDIYKRVKEQNLSVSITPLIDPIQKDTIQTKNFQAWMYEVPATLTYTGDIQTTTQRVLITLTFVAVPTTDSPRGLGVTQMLTTLSNVNP